MLAHRGFHPILSRVSLDAEYHNPSILTPRFLSEYGIVPAHWAYADASSSLRYAEVRYQHNFAFDADPDVLEIEDLRRGVSDSEPSVFQVAARYLEVVQLVNYSGLDVTLRSDALYPGAGAVLHSRFLHPYFQTDDFDYLQMTPRFIFAVGDWSITLRFSQGSVSTQDSNAAETLSVEVFANFNAPVDVGSANRAMNDWPSIQRTIEGVAEDLLWRDHDIVSQSD